MREARMANMISMKCDTDDYAVAYAPGNFPPGLSLNIDEEQCEALGISTALKAGTTVMIQAQAVVTSSTESLELDGDDKGNDVRLQLQITAMGVDVQSELRNAAEMLYGSGE